MDTDTITPNTSNGRTGDPPADPTRTSVNIDISGSASPQHADVCRKAGQLLETVMAKPAFRQKVVSAEYSGGTQFRKRSGQVVQVPKEEIANIILKGVERDTPEDFQLDMKIVPHRHPRGTVGSAILGKGPIRPAVWFLNRCVEKKDAISLARHLMHEWLHVAGFFHKRKGPGQDDVPYQVGDIVREVAKMPDLHQELIERGFEGYLQEDELALYFLDHYEDEVEFSDDQEWWSWLEDDDR